MALLFVENVMEKPRIKRRCPNGNSDDWERVRGRERERERVRERERERERERGRQFINSGHERRKRGHKS